MKYPWTSWKIMPHLSSLLFNLSAVIIFSVFKLRNCDLILPSVTFSVNSWLIWVVKILNLDLKLHVLQCVVMFRSSFRGWRWSSARWPETKRSCAGTSWSSPSTHTCWRSHGPSYTAAPEWVCFYSAAHLSHVCHALPCFVLHLGQDASPHLASSILFSCRWRVLWQRWN